MKEKLERAISELDEKLAKAPCYPKQQDGLLMLRQALSDGIWKWSNPRNKKKDNEEELSKYFEAYQIFMSKDRLNEKLESLCPKSNPNEFQPLRALIEGYMSDLDLTPEGYRLKKLNKLSIVFDNFFELKSLLDRLNQKILSAYSNPTLSSLTPEKMGITNIHDKAHQLNQSLSNLASDRRGVKFRYQFMGILHGIIRGWINGRIKGLNLRHTENRGFVDSLISLWEGAWLPFWDACKGSRTGRKTGKSMYHAERKLFTEFKSFSEKACKKENPKDEDESETHDDSGPKHR